MESRFLQLFVAAFLIAASHGLPFSADNIDGSLSYVDEDAKLHDYLTVLQRLKRQTGSESKRNDLCPEDKLTQVSTDHAKCYRKAEDLLSSQLSSGGDSDLTTVLCSVIRAKVKCITTYAPICLTPERVDVMRFNYLAEEVEKARNNSNFLGYSFINTCPELTNFQSEYILYGYGSNKCSYQEATDYVEEREVCMGKALDKKQRRTALIFDFVTSLDREAKFNTYYQIYCDLEKDWFACLEQTTFRCMTEEKIRERIAKEREGFDEVEQDLRNNGFKFTFAECSKIRSN